MQSKQTRCASIAARVRGGEHAAVGYTTVLEVSLLKRCFYFRNFANGSERKGLSAFTGKFPSSTAGLHLVLKASCLRNKSRLVRYRMVECFHATTIDAKRQKEKDSKQIENLAAKTKRLTAKFLR